MRPGLSCNVVNDQSALQQEAADKARRAKRRRYFQFEEEGAPGAAAEAAAEAATEAVAGSASESDEGSESEDVSESETDEVEEQQAGALAWGEFMSV